MGFGHRILSRSGPAGGRAEGRVEAAGAASGRLDGTAGVREAVERAALDILRERKPERPLDVNVEFYTALLLEALGFAPAVFTCVFAAGRTLGWIAHAREQVLTGRLIRPQSRYVGPRPQLAA
jgi:citrate synthase